MEQKTKQRLGNLSVGDRFVSGFFKKGIYEVAAIVSGGNSRPFVIPVVNGEPERLRGRFMRSSKTVLYIRSTVPVIGKTCFIEDLKPGDKFRKNAQDVHTYVALKPGKSFCRIRRLDQPTCSYAGNVCRVLYLGRS